jgi:hypothetical protein
MKRLSLLVELILLTPFVIYYLIKHIVKGW